MKLYKVVVYDPSNDRLKTLYMEGEIENIVRRVTITNQGAIAQPNIVKSIEYIGDVIHA